MTLGVFIAIAHNGSLSVSSAFTSLSLLTLLTSPLALMFTALPQTFMALACLTRIQEFLMENDQALGLDDGKKFLFTKISSLTNTSVAPGKLGLLSSYTNKPFGTEFNDGIGESSPKLTLKQDIELPSFSTPQLQSSDKGKYILKLENASLGATEDRKPIIHELNLTIARSSLTLVIGKVGSGKSTLLKSLIGELPLSAGSLESMFNESSYCEQQPWLINGSIRDNILGHSKFDDKWYQTVVKSCALDKDLESLSSGSLTHVGSKGISLSGGQKARVVSLMPGDFVHS